MKRHLVAMFALVACALGALAQGFPTVSTAENTVWYLIQFVNGGNAITATAEADATTTSAVGSPDQLWKITGNSSDGYQLTNKKGYTLYVASAAKNQMVKAAASASGVSRFNIVSGNGGYEIQPKGNTGISMNLWGGPNENRGVGLWDKGDQNNPVTFTDASTLGVQSPVSLIPYPQEVVMGEGSLFVAALSAVAYGSEEMKGHIEDFAKQLKTSSGITLNVKKAGDTPSAGEIWFGTDDTLPRDGYTLVVKESGVEIKTSSFGGELYALQTLMQLFPREFFASELCTNNCSATWSLPVVSIKDNPQYEHRGFMMDVARHFFDKDEVKKVLDIMAFYKLNRFHWHLTDDQGWRIEIPEYPKLTEVGAVRAGSFTNNGDGQKFFDDTEYGRGLWFSQADLREIVAYATERNIDILPEIDLPGHMVAAVASYPEFSCDPTKKYEVRIDGGISHDVLNVGKDEVIDFLKCVLGHVAGIFPFPYIHLGGDECPTEQWATNEDCLRRVREEGLAGVQELQSWLVEELGVFLKTEYGKDIVVWDEVLANWDEDNTTTPIIMAWNQSGALSKNAANLGFNSILCPYSHVYIDFPQVPENQMLIDEPYYGGWGTNTIERVYSLNPVAYLDGQEEYCWGAQANLWAETLNDNEELEYCLLPRILALAEVGWLPVEKKNWINFYHRLQSHDEILDQLGYTYAKHYIEPKEYTAAEQAVMEAEEILAASIRGGVGYPAASLYDDLQAVLEAAKASALNTDALTEAIAAYKAAPLVQPEAGKTYRILSASTYYKRQYEGSSMYQKGGGVNFHYTPQTEPEELWQFTPSGNGYILTNCYSGGKLTMETYNAAVTITDGAGTPIRIDKATIAAGGYTYIPGVVTLSAVSGYSATVTGSVKRLSAELSGQVYAKDEAALCYNGTWRIEEVTDYTAWLQGLVDKCEHIILTAQPGETNEPTAEALEFLATSVIAPAKATLTEGTVTKEQYDAYTALYLQFQQMERTGIAQGLSEEYYYHLRNVWFGKYAAVNTSSKTVNHQSSKGNGDNYLWQVVKQPGGSVYLINKATGTAAYPASDGDQTIKVGKNYAWTLEERTLDGKTGICIIDAAGANSWYTNPDVWTYLLLKPFWGACTWEFQQTNIKVVEEGGDTPVVAPTDGIFPQPQQVQWGAEKAFDNTVAYNLVGAADADADAVALLHKYFTTENGTINLTIGERGDAAVAAYESLIPAKSEGYYLSVSKEGVVIAGNDAEGTFYGVQTYLQVAAHAEVKTVTITDWPSIGDRGLVEGYYGNPYSDADRKSLLEFFGRTKMNVYIYGPKDDPYHLDRWREDYPAEEAERFKELVAVAKRNKVRFVWAMHPGKDIQWTDADRAASVAKLEKMYALGIRAFSIFFDDINGAEQSKGDKQAEYLNYLNEHFVKMHDDVAPIIMCPTQYNKAYTGGNDTYLNALGTTLDAETHIMWTGNSVVDMIGKGDMEWVNTRIKRNAYIWLNYPVTDYCRDHILMGPTFGNDLDIAPLLGGFVSNPMEYAEASKVSLYSIGDYCWNMEAYDADASWESAIKYLMPEHSKEFRLFCENNVDLGDNVHGLRRTNESPSFVEARDAFNDLMAQGNTASAVAGLREHFNLMADAATKLMASNYNSALTVEITPWCEVMNYIALKGLELMKMYDALEAAQPETFIESYLKYQEYDEAQSAVRSRDFEGSIRVARPAVGSYHVIPFLKSTLDALVAEYKAHYDEGLDVFPGQEVENGDYFIMYDGKYLTNQSEGVAGTAPTFVEKRDDVKPQRQEWNISLDPATNRYKIVNRQDDRYLNEKGEFTVSNATNPYEAAWHTYNIMRLANGKYCIQNGGSAGNKAWTVSSSRIVKSNEGVEPKYFIFDLVPVNGTVAEAPIISTRDVYYIMDGDRYLTNTNPGGTGGTPTFKSVATPGDAQEWRITIDAAGKNHYKIASDADGRYINEHGVFGTNAYYADWNTYLILTMDDMCAVQITQSAANNLGAHFWNIKNDRLEVDGELTRQNAYVIKIVAKGEVTGPDPEPGVLRQFTVNGSIDGPDNTALPSKVMAQQALDVVLRGAPGYAAKGLTVRYGVNPSGAEFDAEGNRQWSEKYIAATGGKATIPAEIVEGNVNLYATFEREAGTEWSLVFSDEFNAENGSQPVADKWIRCQRQGATWNRWLSDSEEVIYLEDGDLVARAIPNPDKASDPVDMITGGIKSMGKFGFTYGYVEARIYNNLWIGNFPAFWMMPEDQHLGWPDCGEIDIWEVIDTENRSYHTVHSNWTYDLGNTGNPRSSFNTNCSYDRYHTYGLAWDETSLIWYLDGKEVGRYTKSTNQSHLDQGQWPFDKHFHLILNQSVGNGAWAANADITHTYETRFDWVRVYQKDGMFNTNGVVDGISTVEQDAPKNDAIYTLQGVRLNGPVESLPKGLYIVGGEKIVVK